ncbi:right-handed parallel beta-helix repeat-containing protein [Aquimarina algicola]|uniref:Right-handed parallel beta-helix repeat-containing protein n=1 Tax=Aquimarina algicola TaxID=2589995 RepID=A0A504JK76_9FLAO|nr:right-handed parallel beta-helix repeat-containing protein [Aquimarina algicola]TPN86911.1 right-handed parallel beta-helix repeat-containing protein [Aquimarina algicola]
MKSNLKKSFCILVLLIISWASIGKADIDTNPIKIEEESIKKTQKEYNVSNLKEFLEALGNDRKIIIENDIHIKEELKNVVTDTSKFFNNSSEKGWFSPKYENEFYDIMGTYTSSVDTKESLSKDGFKGFIENDIVLVIKKAHNLTITTNTSANIILNQPDDEVIRFDSLVNFKLQNLNIFHRPETDGGCGEFAPVITFYDSRNIIIDTCGLNGSGTEGIYTKNVNNIAIVKTEVFNCNKRGVSFENSKNVKVIKSNIHSNHLDADAEYWDGPSIFYIIESDVEVIETKIFSNSSIDEAPFIDIDDKSKIKFKKCEISQNENFVITEKQKKEFF